MSKQREQIFLDLVRELRALGATRVRYGSMEVELPLMIPETSQGKPNVPIEAEPRDADDLLEWSLEGPLPSTRRAAEKPTDED